MVESIVPLSKNQMLDFIRSVVQTDQQENYPFYVLDLGVVDSLLSAWTCNLPMVQPFYAMKCNPNVTLLKRMADLGIGFECASLPEIQTVLSLGVSADRIIFGNTCKPESHIKYAAKVGVNIAAFDSKCELEKIKKLHPKCGLLLRIKVPETSGTKLRFGKFGALPDEITPLLKTARAEGLDVVGVSFHIGSGAVVNCRAFEDAIATAKATFEIAQRLGLPKMRILDIGAGFVSGPKFIEAASVIRFALEKYFPDHAADDFKIVAEPGRYFAASSFTLATSITGKRVRRDVMEYWLNDGAFGSMNLSNYDRDMMEYTPLTMEHRAKPAAHGPKTRNSTVFGPTCNPLDIVVHECQLPELELNDWLIFHHMGAYTSSCGTDFNGFKTSAIPTYLCHQENPIMGKYCEYLL